VRVAQILARLTADGATVEQLPDRLVRLGLTSLPLSGASIALATAAGPTSTLAATAGAAREVEEQQFALGEGPCVDAARSSRPVLVPDLRRSGPARWPILTPAALALGVGAVFAFPLHVGAIRLGVLGLYSDQAGLLSQDELAEALHLADAATTVLLHLASVEEAHPPFRDDRAGGPRVLGLQVLDGRAEVHQATGALAETLTISLEQALMLLRARAFSSGRAIADVAVDVLAGRLDLADDGGP
jgi:hypothetical protein